LEQNNAAKQRDGNLQKKNIGEAVVQFRKDAFELPQNSCIALFDTFDVISQQWSNN